MKPLPVAWVEALLDYSRGSRMGLALRLVARMGLRQREVRELRVRDFPARKGVLLVRGPNARVQPVPRECFPSLVQFSHGRGDSEFLIPGYGGVKPMGARSLQGYLLKIVPIVLGPGYSLSIRELRETCILNRLRAGQDPVELQREFGIVTEATMRGYVEAAMAPREFSPGVDFSFPSKRIPDFRKIGSK